MARAYVPWFDSTMRAKAEDIVAMVTDPDDRALLLRWMDNPLNLSRADLIRVEQVILPAIKFAIDRGDEQVSYRWVDNRTGEVDGPQ